jgi:hypothetical protein
LKAIREMGTRRTRKRFASGLSFEDIGRGKG